MTTKSKSPLLIIISLAVIFFITAVIWKNTHLDNSENIYIAPINITEKIKPKNKLIIVEDEQSEVGSVEYTREEKRKHQQERMNVYTSYKTPEELMDVIIYLQDNDQNEKADRYLALFHERFPDFED